MSAANTDLLRKATPVFSTTLSANIGVGDTTIPLTITTRLPTDTGITLTIDATSPTGSATPLSREVVTGVIVGTNLTNALRGQDGTTAQSHLSGAVVVDYDTAQVHNDMVIAILADHNQDGSHKPFSENNLIGSNQLQANAVTSGKIATGAVVASNIAAGAVTSTGILDGTIAFADLATSIFGGQIQTYTPASGAVTNCTVTSVTGNYLNLGGFKAVWGIVSVAWNAGTVASVSGITLPTSFFGSTPTMFLSIQSEGAYAYQVVSGNSASTTTFQFYLSNGGATATTQVSFFLIGT